MELTMESVNEILKDKLQNLVSFLCQITNGFETIAEDIECTNLKTAMIALSVESKQYAEEIRNQLEDINLTVPAGDSDELWNRIEMNVHEQASFSRGGEIVALCNNCEMYFNKLYEDILQEYFPFKKFKDIIKYQLYATQCAFMKIRLLNALRFNS
ncbi:MAG: hypothetical protein ABIR78_04105 [Ferruginibacter sp.]